MDYVSAPDLTSDVNVPSKVKVGRKCLIKVTVKNVDNEDADQFTVALYIDGKYIDSKSINQLIAGESGLVTFELVHMINSLS
ncbi:MAG TPA: hypothetical protein EYH56_00935 [Nanoarchaeota archaeon]|nr:hypothetical protein [Nanoarchaeota archaeon]